MKNFSENSIKCLPLIFSLLLFFVQYDCANGDSIRKCFSCNGINCLRKSLNKVETCNDPLDVCVTIFKDFTIESKGCLLNTPEELSSKCNSLDNNIECDICQGDLCNKYGRRDFLCVECNSEIDTNCKNDPLKIEPIRCPAPTALNSYCFIKNKNGVVERGCSTETSHQMDCANSKDSDCSLCIPSDTEICNAPGKRTITLGECPNKSSAFKLKQNTFLIIGIIFLFTKKAFF